MVTIGELNEHFRAALQMSQRVPMPPVSGRLGETSEVVPLFEAVNRAAELFDYPFRAENNADLDDGSVRLDVARMLYFGLGVVAALRSGRPHDSVAACAETMSAFVDDEWIIETLEALGLDHLPFIDAPRSPQDVYPESVRLLRSDLVFKLASLTMLAASR